MAEETEKTKTTDETSIAEGNVQAQAPTLDDDIELAYPESYTEDEQNIADSLCDYLGMSMNKYTAKELAGLVKFCYDFFGIALDYGWDDRPGWFAVTKDMAYDQIAKMKAEAEALDK